MQKEKRRIIKFRYTRGWLLAPIATRRARLLAHVFLSCSFLRNVVH